MPVRNVFSVGNTASILSAWHNIQYWRNSLCSVWFLYSFRYNQWT